MVIPSASLYNGLNDPERPYASLEYDIRGRKRIEGIEIR